MANFAELFMTPVVNGLAVCYVLEDAKNAGMNFLLGSVKVSEAKLKEVAQAIRDERITVEIHSGLGGDAEYRFNDDAIWIGSVATMSEIATGDPLACSLVVHEAVHAANDMAMSGQSVLRTENEAAAYLAQAYYLRKHGWEKGEKAKTGRGSGYMEDSQSNDLIFEMKCILGFALEVIDKLLEAYVDPVLDLATQEETKESVLELKRAIARMRPYKDSGTFWTDTTSYNGLAKGKPKPKKQKPAKAKK